VPDLGWLLRRHGFEVVVGAGVLWILGGVGLYRVEPRGAWPNFIAVGVALLVVGLSLKIGVADRVKTSTYQPRAERSERWLRFWRVRIPVLIGLGVACVGGAIVAKEEFGNPQAAVLFVCALTFGWLVAWMEGRGKSN
jgi:hypothetical protein